ncbi:MAG: hypothetical protein AAFN41_05815, partial [Planctomycetota bacterium]
MDDQRQPEPLSPWIRLRRWALRLSVAGIAISLLVHVGMLIAAALLLVGGGGGVDASGDGPSEVVEFAVMPESE